jgi:hypothetical protein
MQLAAQLLCLPIRLDRQTAERDVLAAVVADLSDENLEGTPLVAANRFHVPAVDGKRDRRASAGGAEVGSVAASLSSLAPTCRVRWRIVSTSGVSPSGKNSSSSERARRYGSTLPILARVRS